MDVRPMNLALVPVKRLAAGKSRLAAALGREATPALTLAMLGDVLAALRDSHRVDRIVVATPDPEVGEAVRTLGAEARVADDPGLNAALDAAARALADPAGALLVVLGDVAGASGAELAQLFDALDALGGNGAVLAAARDGGTAALLRRPPGAIPSCFGAESAKAHRAAAERAGAPFRELALPSLAIDLDRSEDLAALLASDAAAPRTRALLARLGVKA
jgi:2-phospho-L-lactate/phosphoenolpyruvate guanylyltransferase